MEPAVQVTEWTTVAEVPEVVVVEEEAHRGAEVAAVVEGMSVASVQP